jgi:hypothetical protein
VMHVMRAQVSKVLMDQHAYLSKFHSENADLNESVAQLALRAMRYLQEGIKDDGTINVEVHLRLAECAMSASSDKTAQAAAIAANGVRHLEVCLHAFPRGESAWGKIQNDLASLKATIADSKEDATFALEAVGHHQDALQAFLGANHQDELQIALTRMNLARLLLGGLASRSLPLGEEYYAGGLEHLLEIERMSAGTPDLYEMCSPMLRVMRSWQQSQQQVSEHGDTPGQPGSAPISLAETVEELPLNADSLACVVVFVPQDDLLSFSLTSGQFNAARVSARLQLSTLARSTFRSVSLSMWASSLGCPAAYPFWAMVHNLVSASDLNGRVCRVLGPPNEKGRHKVEIDSGWGSMYPRQLPAKESERHGAMDLSNVANKLVRLDNLRVLADNEMLRATRILCRGETALHPELVDARPDVELFLDQALQSANKPGPRQPVGSLHVQHRRVLSRARRQFPS